MDSIGIFTILILPVQELSISFSSSVCIIFDFFHQYLSFLSIGLLLSYVKFILRYFMLFDGKWNYYSIVFHRILAFI